MDRMTALKERRISPRLDAVRKNRSRIESGSPSGPSRATAILINISREGALIVADETPQPYQTIWLRMEEPAKTDWIAAVALRCGDAGKVGLRFVDRCPDDWLLAATLGIDLGPLLLGGPRPESVDDCWP